MISCELSFYIRTRLIAPQYFSLYSGDLVCIIVNHFLAYISVGKSEKYFNLDKSTAAGQECILARTDVPQDQFLVVQCQNGGTFCRKDFWSFPTGRELSISQQCYAFGKKINTIWKYKWEDCLKMRGGILPPCFSIGGAEVLGLTSQELIKHI